MRMVAPTADQQAMAFERISALQCALTDDEDACRSQYRFFADLEAGRFPTGVELATGPGKTSIVELRVLALGQALGGSPSSVTNINTSTMPFLEEI